jgi:hypothetical protein
VSTSRLYPLRPVPHLDAARLERLCDEGQLSVGAVVSLGEKRYRVHGFDPVGARKRRVYLEELGTRRQHELVVEG